MDRLKKSSPSNDITIVLLFFLIPTIMLIIGSFIFPYPSSPSEQPLSYIPLFLGLVLLGIGSFWKGKNLASKLKIVGWTSFSFFWAMMPSFLYFSEDGDVFNASVCIVGVYVLMYMAYHEWLSIKRNESISCLDWIAGGTFIAGMIYFIIDSSIFPQLKQTLIDTVAAQSTWLLNILGFAAEKKGLYISYGEETILIIFACTAIQAIVLFVGMIGALQNITIKRKAIAVAITIIPIYLLNLVRNASVIVLVGRKIASFNVAHNYLAKAGALITLIALLFIIFKIIPELYDEISCLFDLTKRKGPIENLFIKLLGKKTQ